MKIINLLLLMMLSLLLSACSVKSDAAELYKQETPLEATIIFPETITANMEQTIKVTLTQDGKKVEHAEQVHIEMWKQDGSVKDEMEEAREEGNGVYSITKTFPEDGLYYVKVHAENSGSIIMPQKQIIVGELSESELKFLQSGASSESGVGEKHH